MEFYDVCVLCALPKEANAFKQVIENHGLTVEKKYSQPLERDYYHAILQNNVGEQLRTLITWLPNMGSLYTISDFLNILQNFRLRFAVMTGICAGDKTKLTLGDLIVAERTYLSDNGSFFIDEDGKTSQLFDTKTISLSNDILHFAKGFEDWKQEGFLIPRPPSKHQQRDWLLNTLLEKKTIAAIGISELDKHAPMWRTLNQELQKAKEPFLNTKLELIDPQQVENLVYGLEKFPYTDPPTPKCLIEAMASSNAVHKDSPFPEISKPVRKVAGMDMESMAFYHTLQEKHNIRSLVVKGVSDYADGNKDDSYHDYAATLSALYAYTFIKNFVTEERMPWPQGQKPTPAATINNLAQPTTTPTTQNTVDSHIMDTKDPAQETGKKPMQIFFSCSDAEEDRDLIRQLDKHLFLLKRQLKAESWYRYDIALGNTTKAQIAKHLREADLIILLLTPDYLISDFYTEEYQQIQIRSEQGALVIPILLKSIDEGWKDEFYGKFQALPRNQKPVDSYEKKDAPLAAIAGEIRKVIIPPSKKM